MFMFEVRIPRATRSTEVLTALDPCVHFSAMPVQLWLHAPPLLLTAVSLRLNQHFFSLTYLFYEYYESHSRHPRTTQSNYLNEARLASPMIFPLPSFLSTSKSESALRGPSPIIRSHNILLSHRGSSSLATVLMVSRLSSER